METTIRLASFPKVWNLGHPNVKDLLTGPVVVQEKIDGSQFSFGVLDGDLLFRSRGAIVYEADPGELFKGACVFARELCEQGWLKEGLIYRGEAVCRNKHNTLCYARVPKGNFVLFDIDTGPETRVEHLASLKPPMEVAPVLYEGPGEELSLERLQSFLELESFLGGEKVEGVVIKNYHRFNYRDGKQLMGKLVRPDFREKNGVNWKKENPGKNDVIATLKQVYRNENRWLKAVQHLSENGQLEHNPRDIGLLLKTVQEDIGHECEAEISKALFDAFWPEIRRGVVTGLPEWYKEKLRGS